MTTTTSPAIVSSFSSTGTVSNFTRLHAHSNTIFTLYCLPKRHPRLRILHKPAAYTKQANWTPSIYCFSYESSETPADEAPAPAEAKMDLKLPRRRLLVQFTCNACGERSKKLINRVAYERGTVFVQCAGCLQHHKLVDNLGLVIEYDLRKEDDQD